jgi:hypothetical protein
VLASAECDTIAACVRRYTALRGGTIAGGAGLRLASGAAQLTGAATALAHCRQGIQSTLLGGQAR